MPIDGEMASISACWERMKSAAAIRLNHGPGNAVSTGCQEQVEHSAP
jgi:hypothetical protein